MNSTELRIGLFAGIISVVLLSVEFYFGLNETSWGIAFDFAIFFLLGASSYIAVKEKREAEGGIISFGKAFIAALGTCFVIALIAGAFSFIYTKYVNPQLTELMVEKARQIMEGRNLSQTEIENGMKNIRTMYSPKGQFMMTSGTTMLYAVFISLVVAVFTSGKKRG